MMTFKILRIFYQSVVASAAFFAVICWGSSFKARNSKKLNKLIKKAVGAGDCSRAPCVGCGEKDVAQATQHNGHYTSFSFM